MSDLAIRPIIGMEIHVQLATRTKLFCGCPLEFGAEPNSRVCPVCGGLPGALPVINRRAVEFALRVALALDCRVATFTKWDRKSYFYPDLPKNYQISQYDLPLGAEGRFELPGEDRSDARGKPPKPSPLGGRGLGEGVSLDSRSAVAQSERATLTPALSPGGRGSHFRTIRIRRAHLEEDAGKNTHEGLNHTRVDLNRAGTPLLEIVTEPDLASADEACRFAVELQRLVRHLGVSAADMQKGQMRFEPNVNVSITDGGREYRTPICEIKNLNSFRAVRDAIAYEVDRQVRAWRADPDYTLERHGKMNFGWNDARGVTEFQRGKEEAHDYRYFPDPDLTPVTIDEAMLVPVRAALGELPLARQQRYVRGHGLSVADAENILSDRATGDWFDAAVAAGGEPRTLARQMLSFWSAEANARLTTIAGLGVSPAHGAELARLTIDGAINATTAAAVAAKMLSNSGAPGSGATGSDAAGRGPREMVEAEGLAQVRDDSSLEAWVGQALAANPQAVADYANPKKSAAALGFLRGQVMRLSGGKADAKRVGEMIQQKLSAG